MSTTLKSPPKKKTPAGPNGASERVFPPGRSDAKQTIGIPQSASAPVITSNEQIQDIPVEQIERSPWNREKRNPDSFAELVASIAEHGIVQPIILRPASYRRAGFAHGKPPFELVAGEGRWLAAQKLGKKTVPAIVRMLNDTQALEVQAIENISREDLNPIDEAKKYKQLLEEPGYNIERLCQVTGKKKSTVYELLALLNLPTAVQGLVEDGGLKTSHAGLLTKLTDEKEVCKIAVQVIDDRISFREAKEMVDKAVTVQENRKKWQIEADGFRNKGLKVLSQKECHALFPHNNEYPDTRKGYIVGGHRCYDDFKSRPWTEAMGKFAPDPVLAIRPDGSPVIVYPEDTAKAAVRKNQGKKPVSKTPDPEKKAQQLLKIRRGLFGAAMKSVVNVSSTTGFESEAFWRFAIVGLIRNSGSDTVKMVAKRREWGEKGRDAFTVLREQAAKLCTSELRGLALELILSRSAPSTWSGEDWSKQIKDACEMCGVDWRALTQAFPMPKEEAPKADPQEDATI